jgi:hypothetical protein
VHGTSISGQDDRDEMGICFEPAEYVTGLARVPNGIDGEGPAVEFEQYERHTAWDRAGGVANRSGAGDLDVVIYCARKWCRLALAGNPTVLAGALRTRARCRLPQTKPALSSSTTRTGSSRDWPATASWAT